MALPLVLAGPIVRRVDANTASFWVALSAAATVEAKVWAGDQVSTGDGTVQTGDPVVGEGSVQARKWGDHLFTATVTASTDGHVGGLAPGTVHSYDLMVDGQGLRGLGLLADESGAHGGIDAAAPDRLALGYLTDHLPTFATPSPTVPGLRIAHTSCRKPHGRGPDALAWLDDTIKDNRLDVDKRPQQLFLTGDQIYADDVAACMLAMLQPVAKELLGYDETVPMSGGAAGNANTRVKTADLPPLRRGRLAIEVARLSSTDNASHLIGFGEFAAMYLAVWSPRVWRAIPDRDQYFIGVPQGEREARHLTDFEKKYANSVTDWKAADVKSQEQDEGTGPDRARIVAFAQTVAKVARVLANSATYMIFDDHEITDDWAISSAWRTRVLTSALGATVIRNGLLAYVAFQATGNDPAAWEEPLVLAGGPPPTKEVLLRRAIDVLVGDKEAPTPAHLDAVDEFIGLQSPTAVPQVTFHYKVDGPRHRVVVLDTRTRRTYDGTRLSPPKLVGDSLDAMLPAGPLADGREVLFVVSAAPVLFPHIFDALVQPAAAAWFDFHTYLSGKEDFKPEDPKPSIVGAEQWDIEGWGAVESAFHAFVRRVATYPQVVLLGGDVHFASSLSCDVWTKGDDTCDSRILQCTSSASKNEPPVAMRAVLRAQRSAQALLRGEAVERLGWDGAHGVVLPQAASIPPGRRARLMRSPTFVPAGGWPSGTTLDGAKPPDVRYRVSVLRDGRPSAALGVDAPKPPTLPSWNAADPIASYAGVAASHQQLFVDDKDPIRLMVFRSNVGIVTFEASPTTAASFAATHAIMSPVGDGTTGVDYTHHTLDLARAAATAPPALATGG